MTSPHVRRPANGSRSRAAIHRATVDLAMFLCVAIASSGSVRGQADQSLSLLDVVSRARDQWKPVADNDVSDALATVQESVVGIERFLESQAQYADGWRAFLRWDQLQKELNQTEPPGVAFLRLTSRFLAAAAPLTEPNESFVVAAEAFDSAATTMLRAKTTSEQFNAQLDRLAQALSRLRAVEAPPQQDASQIAQDMTSVADVIHWLHERGYGEWAQPVREYFVRPNLFLDVSEGVLQSAVTKRETLESAVRDVILGTTYVGSSTTSSITGLDLVANRDGVSTRYTYEGEAQIRTNGYNQGATVRTSSVSTFRGEKLLNLTTVGITMSPASATAVNRSRILDVSTSRVLGNRVARNRAYQQKNATERQVGQRTAALVRQEMDTYFRDLVKSSRDTFVRRFRIPLHARNAFPEVVSLTSTDLRARMSLLVANSGQLSTTTSPPEVLSQEAEADVVCQLHESLVNNLADSYLGGRRLRDVEIGEMIKELFGRVPEGFQQQDGQETWTIGFDIDAPCVVRFGEDTLTLEIRATDMLVGETAYPGAEISAHYDLDPQATTLVGKRSGRLRVSVRDVADAETQLGVRQQVFRSMVRRRFDRILPMEINWKQLDLPDPWPEDRQLEMTAARGANGWLTLIMQQRIVPQSAE
jgi:hypothetical protein